MPRGGRDSLNQIISRHHSQGSVEQEGLHPLLFSKISRHPKETNKHRFSGTCKIKVQGKDSTPQDSLPRTNSPAKTRGQLPPRELTSSPKLMGDTYNPARRYNSRPKRGREVPRDNTSTDGRGPRGKLVASHPQSPRPLSRRKPNSSHFSFRLPSYIVP